jgi:hypothetical protein
VSRCQNPAGALSCDVDGDGDGDVDVDGDGDGDGVVGAAASPAGWAPAIVGNARTVSIRHDARTTQAVGDTAAMGSSEPAHSNRRAPHRHPVHWQTLSEMEPTDHGYRRNDIMQP